MSSSKKKFLRAKPRKNETPEQAAQRIVVAEGKAPLTLEQATLMKETYLAKLRQLEYDLKAGAVVASEDVERAVVEEYLEVRNGLHSLGARLAPQLVPLRDPEQIKAAIDTAVFAALAALGTKALQDDPQ